MKTQNLHMIWILLGFFEIRSVYLQKASWQTLSEEMSKSVV